MDEREGRARSFRLGTAALRPVLVMMLSFSYSPCCLLVVCPFLRPFSSQFRPSCLCLFLFIVHIWVLTLFHPPLLTPTSVISPAHTVTPPIRFPAPLVRLFIGPSHFICSSSVHRLTHNTHTLPPRLFISNRSRSVSISSFQVQFSFSFYLCVLTPTRHTLYRPIPSLLETGELI